MTWLRMKIALSLLLFFGVTPLASAALRCEALFQSGFAETIPGLQDHLAPADFIVRKGLLASLAQKLISANLEHFEKNPAGPGFNLEDYVYSDIFMVNSKPHFALFSVEFRNRKTGANYSIPVRSNGRVAFLQKTWKYRNPLESTPEAQRFQVVYLDKEGFKSIDQGEAFISSLPRNFQLSRSMSQTERNRWLTDEAFWSHYGQRVHFAPQYFRFSNEPYQISISKKEFLEAYRRGEVEINTYDDLSKMPNKIWMGNIQLEFEIVFIGEAGVETLRPFMRKDLQQGILAF